MGDVTRKACGPHEAQHVWKTWPLCSLSGPLDVRRCVVTGAKVYQNRPLIYILVTQGESD